jgi:outer membrane protein TolC
MASGQRPLTLSDLEELVVQRDPGVKAAEYQIKALQYRGKEARATNWPEFRAGYVYNSNPVFGEVSQGYSNTQHHAEAGVTFNVLKRLALSPGEQKKIDLQVKAAEQEQLRAVQEAKWRVRQLYLDYHDSRLREKDYLAMVGLMEEALKLAQLGQRQREVLPLDILNLEKQLQDARQQVQLALKAQEERRTLLASYAGLEPASLQLAPYSLQNRKGYNLTELVRKMRESHPDLALNKFRAQEAETDAAYAPYNYLNFHLDAFYNVDHYRTLGTRTGALLGARFNSPLAVFSLTRNRRQRSLNEAEAWNSRGHARAASIEQDMLLALEKLRAFELRHQNTVNQVKIVEENARVRQVLSSQPSLVASMSRLDLLAAQYLVMEAKRELAAVDVEREKAYYYLLYLAGISDGHQGQASVKENPSSVSRPLAMWVYYPDRLMDQDKLGELLSFSKDRGVKRLYLCLNYPLIDNLPKYRPILEQFITAAGKQGTVVEALVDEPTFLLPEKRRQLEDFLRAVQVYNLRAPTTGRFQAIHLDLEIQQLPDWQERKEELARMWLDTVKFVKSREPLLPLVIDLPIWLARYQIPFWQDIIQAADEVVFMAYEQKTPQQLLQAFIQEWAFAAQAKKPVWIGLNLSDFAGQGESTFFNYVNEVGRQAPHPVAGFALFKYPDYKLLSK